MYSIPNVRGDGYASAHPMQHVAYGCAAYVISVVQILYNTTE